MAHIQRRQEILDLLKIKKQLSPKTLCERLHVSTATLRRDLVLLEQEGLIKRFHGVVSIIGVSNVEPSYQQRALEQRLEKNHICDIAADFIADGQSLFLDSSTTVNQICPYLSQKNNLVVITNGLQTALTLNQMENITVFLVGGEMKAHSASTVGALATDFVLPFRIDLALFSCRGLDEGGIYEASHHQAHFKKHMITLAKQNILLCDDSKFKQPHFYKLAQYEDFKAIITNKEPDEQYKQLLKNAAGELLW